jgi:hypothetical protein
MRTMKKAILSRRSTGLVLIVLGIACSLIGWSASAAAVPAPRAAGAPAIAADAGAVAVAGGSTASVAGFATCRYICRNPSTGQLTIRSATTSRTACCSGQGLPCPAGTTFDGPISWNGMFIQGC